YYFDLAALQEKFPEISSKKALSQFFEETPFLELELVCTHLPPWIESLGYDITFKKQNEKTVAVIKKKLCGKVML
ncbi:MAG TPA: Fe-only nitrogenase accessory AnfO family protein, partial [Oscillospiraceae bacterium]|nr:Fe-only nitrogenase accessory AnfO family protein [Oscillospiraceae bacterium]